MKKNNNTIIDSILKEYLQDLGKDFETYKNHVYRIFYLSISLDSNPSNQDKYAIASAFHDIGIWTHSFDYLKPSIDLAVNYLNENNLSAWSEEISFMIDNHHKRSVYQGKYSETVEVFRKADWLDVTSGIKMFDFDKKAFKSLKKQFPLKGFHWFLIKQSVSYFFKHPGNPLPMFKK